MILLRVKEMLKMLKLFYGQAAYQFSKQNISSPYTQGLLFLNRQIQLTQVSYISNKTRMIFCYQS
jgi:hypothetical protein